MRTAKVVAVATAAALVFMPTQAWAHGDGDGHEDTVDMTAGVVPGSTAYDGDAAPEQQDGVMAMSGALAALSTCAGERTALLQDNVPWLAGNSTLDPLGLGANGIELEAQGADFCVLRSWDLGTVDLAGFDRIVVSSAQSQTFYNRLFPSGVIHADIEAFVSGGGTLIANLADRASGPGNGGAWSGTFVGGVRKASRYSNDNDLASGGSAHPVISGDLPCLSLNCGQVRDWEQFDRVDVDDWGYASHGYFTNLPAGATSVMTDGAGPALVTYAHGSGHVVASMLTTEWRYLGGFSSYVQNQALLANLLAYRYRANCTDDSDCDGLSNVVEGVVGTNPTKSDTDGDGLLDPWEVDPSVAGAGFRESYPDGPLLDITRDDVFGPHGDACIFPDKNLRVKDQLSCFNAAPDPLHKDVYFEMDWQDCQVDDCPEIVTLKVDPIHHSPNIIGIGYAANMFRNAPVTNPDNERGVNLHVLVDERIAHSVNCDQDDAQQRDEHFGTPQQRDHPEWDAIREVRTKAVRYIWSGHSSVREGDCPNPNPVSFGATGFGLRNMEEYDFSPFGDVNLGGDDLLVTLGPIWSCPGIVGVRGPWPGPCYNATEVVTGWGHSSTIWHPGIFPSQIDTPSGEIDAPYPIARMLGMTEQWGGIQLWERTLAHLIGHSLGLPSHDQVANNPAMVGTGVPGQRTPRSSTWYSTFGTRLRYAPSGDGTAKLAEPLPDYVGLAENDADGDGTPEGEDNCPGIPNEDQKNSDIDEFGDACEGDTDGDGLIEGSDNEGFAAASLLAQASDSTRAAPATDPYPDDTDNDGVRNDDDADDDGDGHPDDADNCRLVMDPAQTDTDADGAGDACDLDDDGDSYPDSAEEYGGSAPLDATSTWELLGWETTCGDGVDNDRDGSADGDDLGCVDTDSDRSPDLLDSCPRTASRNFFDNDGDGIGDVCDDTPYGSTVAELWIADNEDVFVSDKSTGIRQVDPSELGAIATAVDAERQVVWTYGDGRLRSLSSAGKEIVSVAVPGATDNEQKVTVAVGLQGDVWVATKRVMSRFDSNGTLLAQRTVDRDVIAMAFDPSTETMWVATDTTLLGLDSDLAVGATIALGKVSADIEIGEAGAVWVTVGTEVRSYSRKGALLSTFDLGRTAGVVEQAHGRLWVAVHDGLAVVDQVTGKFDLVDGFPESSGPKVVDIEPDASGVWVADNSRARFVGTDLALGEVVVLPTAGTTGRVIRDIAVLATGAPEPEDDSLGVLVLSPAMGGYVGSDTVTVRGVVNGPARVTINGVEAVVGEDRSFTAELADLAEGRTTLTVVATNDAGERAVSTIDVVVDRTGPVAPTVSSVVRTSTNLVRVAGTTEPGAVVEIHNASLTEGDIRAVITADDRGQYSTTLLAARGHTLDVTATDLAGNVSAKTVVLAP